MHTLSNYSLCLRQFIVYFNFGIMKKNGLLWVLASALMLCFTYTSCEEMEGLFDDDEKASGEEAFFPKAYADKELAAWYKWTEKDKDKTKTEAVFLFKDNTFVVTKNKVHTDGRYERDIEAFGTYQLTEGDYKNGKAKVIVMSDSGEAVGQMNVVIEDGHLTTDQGDEVFTIQDNAKRPKPSDPASGNNNQGGNNQGGDGNGSGAFFPKAYAGKSIEAWFAYSGSDSGDGFEMKYVAAIYFFVDGSFVATSNVAVSGPTGQSYERTVGAEGSWRIVEGNFNTGKVAITYDKDNTVILEIEDGQLKAIDTENGGVTIYIKQDNSKVPEPSDPTQNGNHGGGQGGDNGGESDVPAFFPTTYADKTVAAWYSFSISSSVQTQVEAVFLFEDGTIIATEHKVFSSELQMPAERYVWMVGTYELSGNYDNGRADITLVPERKTFLTIDEGGLKLEDNNFEYTRRELKDLPEPLEPTFNGGQGEGGDDDGDDDDDESDVKLVAWYTQILNMNGSDYEMAIILLDDNTIVFTRTQLGDDPGVLYMTEIVAKGTYSLLDGDYTSGRVLVYMYGDESDFTIVNGVITGGEIEGEYTKQDNDKYTGPTDFGDDDDDDDDGDDDDGDDEGGYIGEITPYYPAQYAEKTVAAWYLSADIDENQVKIQTVFLFTDKSLVKTTSKFHSVNDGRDPEYILEAEGRYEIKQGDYTDGVASVMLNNGQTFDVEIISGLMFAMEEYFAIQDIADLPTPIKAK